MYADWTWGWQFAAACRGEDSSLFFAPNYFERRDESPPDPRDPRNLGRAERVRTKTAIAAASVRRLTRRPELLTNLAREHVGHRSARMPR
jgi:hypothetical protein